MIRTACSTCWVAAHTTLVCRLPVCICGGDSGGGKQNMGWHETDKTAGDGRAERKTSCRVDAAMRTQNALILVGAERHPFKGRRAPIVPWAVRGRGRAPDGQAGTRASVASVVVPVSANSKGQEFPPNAMAQAASDRIVPRTVYCKQQATGSRNVLLRLLRTPQLGSQAAPAPPGR